MSRDDQRFETWTAEDGTRHPTDGLTGQIQQALAQSLPGVSEFSSNGRKCFAAILGNLRVGELPLGVISCFSNYPGVALLTNRRLMFHGRLMGSTNVQTISLESVESVDGTRGPMYGAVFVISAGKNLALNNTPPDKAEPFSRLVSEVIAHLRSAKTNESIPPPPSAPSLADELLKISALRDSGVLSEAEFELAKHRLLGG